MQEQKSSLQASKNFEVFRLLHNSTVVFMVLLCLNFTHTFSQNGSFDRQAAVAKINEIVDSKLNIMSFGENRNGSFGNTSNSRTSSRNKSRSNRDEDEEYDDEEYDDEEYNDEEYNEDEESDNEDDYSDDRDSEDLLQYDADGNLIPDSQRTARRRRSTTRRRSNGRRSSRKSRSKKSSSRSGSNRSNSKNQASPRKRKPSTNRKSANRGTRLYTVKKSVPRSQLFRSSRRSTSFSTAGYGGSYGSYGGYGGSYSGYLGNYPMKSYAGVQAGYVGPSGSARSAGSSGYFANRGTQSLWSSDGSFTERPRCQSFQNRSFGGSSSKRMVSKAEIKNILNSPQMSLGAPEQNFNYRTPPTPKGQKTEDKKKKYLTKDGKYTTKRRYFTHSNYS